MGIAVGDIRAEYWPLALGLSVAVIIYCLSLSGAAINKSVSYLETIPDNEMSMRPGVYYPQLINGSMHNALLRGFASLIARPIFM